MATKKRLLLIASLPLSIVVIIGVLAMLPPRSGVTRDNFDKIEKGMTLADVTEIFGEKSITVVTFGNAANPGALESWQGPHGTIVEVYLSNDKVYEMRWMHSTGNVFDKINRWLHLP